MAYTFIDFAQEVLEKTNVPLTFPEIWQKGCEFGLDKKLGSTGKTPWNSLGAILFVQVRDNPKTPFTKIKAGRSAARFYLKDRNVISEVEITKLETDIAKKREKQVGFHERELHPLLAYFAYTNLAFNRGRSVLTKTIFHEKSKKDGYSEWLHPDMVGFYLPLEDWSADLIDFNRITDNNALLLYSFELKKVISQSDYREAFFQAVSNSTWAHEGYLVAADIDHNDEGLMTELERLSQSFGVGVIHLDLTDIDAAKVLFSARRRSELDWDTMSKLSEKNPDFKKFLQDVKIDFESKRIHKSEFDKVMDDPQEYIEKMRKHN